MYEPEAAADKMLDLVDCVVKYKSIYLKNRKTDKLKASLSERQFKILITLSINETNTVSEMARFMNISKSTLSIILSKMMKKALVCKETPSFAEDKRKTYFKITKNGMGILKELKDAAIEDFKAIYKALPQETKMNVSKGINKLNISVSSSKVSFYHIINDIYDEMENADNVSKLAFKLYLFFICFAEYCDSILKEDKQYREIFKSLTRTRYKILQSISGLNLDTVSKLEEHLCSSGSSVSIAISKLVKEGYLYKEYPSADDDGRVVYIRLTDKGNDIIYDAKKNISRVLTMYFTEFSEGERKNVIEAFELLLSAFENPFG